MIGGLLAASLLAAGSGEVLDAAGLREAMESAREAPAAADSLAGRPFQISIPFVDERKRTMRVLQSPARWRYDYSRGELTVMIGLGQISADNYSRFGEQGLTNLPTLQTAFFDGSELRSAATVETTKGTVKRQEVGVQSVVTNYGLAIPFAEGVSDLPPRFQPFMVYKVRMNQQAYHRLTRGMKLVLNGRLTALGQRPEVFCGEYDGRLAAPDTHIDDTVYTLIKARQCFTTARVDAVSVVGGGDVVLANWGPGAR
jgi:hypothetical protein